MVHGVAVGLPRCGYRDVIHGAQADMTPCPQRYPIRRAHLKFLFRLLYLKDSGLHSSKVIFI